MNLFKKLFALSMAIIISASLFAMPVIAEEPTYNITEGDETSEEPTESTDDEEEPTESSDDEEEPTEPISPISEYSIFETIKIRRDLITETGVFTNKDYKDVSKFLINKSEASTRRFTLTYNFDGYGVDGYKDPSVLDAVERVYKSNFKIAPAGLERENYINTGWTYNGEVYLGGDTFQMPANDVVLEPIWCRYCKMSYTAGDYDDINGNNYVYVMSAENCQFFLADSERFSRPGYTIIGWLSSYDGVTYFPSSAIKVPEADVNFEAVWGPAEYNVNISANNGKLTDKLTLKAKYAEDFVLPECEFEYAGKTFAGWKYNGSIYQPGESFTVPALLSGSKIVVVATWK